MLHVKHALFRNVNEHKETYEAFSYGSPQRIFFEMSYSTKGYDFPTVLK